MNRLKGVTTPEDEKPIESTQCKSDTTSHPASPSQSDRSDIDSTRHSPRIEVPADSPPPTKEGMQRTLSSDSNSSNVMDADSPRTSDNSSHLSIRNNTPAEQSQPPLADDGPSWAQTYPHFPPENFVGPNLQELDQELALGSHVFHRGAAAAGVKLEEMHGSCFPTDQAFLLSRLEEQTVLPNWWDWA